MPFKTVHMETETEEKTEGIQDESLSSHVRENIRSKNLCLSQTDTNDKIGEWGEEYVPQLQNQDTNQGRKSEGKKKNNLKDRCRAHADFAADLDCVSRMGVGRGSTVSLAWLHAGLVG